jgi:hypothetical protein
MQDLSVCCAHVSTHDEAHEVQIQAMRFFKYVQLHVRKWKWTRYRVTATLQYRSTSTVACVRCREQNGKKRRLERHLNSAVEFR